MLIQMKGGNPKKNMETELLQVEKADEVFDVKKIYTTAELLNVEKEDFEFLIKELHKIADVLENTFVQTQARETQKRFLREVNTEINWNECRLEEIKQSILVEESRE